MTSTSPDLVPDEGAKAESTVTVLVALGANALIAVAKTIAAVTGAASMLAEAAHSVAQRLNDLEDKLQSHPRVVRATLTLSRPGAPPITQ